MSPSPKLRAGSASWSALRRLASVPSNEARLGVNGFGAFCRNKKPVLSPAEGGLACRGETRQHRISLGHERWGHQRGIDEEYFDVISGFEALAKKSNASKRHAGEPPIDL
ncbi:MAG: hypothetical protein H0W49_00640 [Nitrospirales bacterium]|nr:hypothetical protein [Nitrospirales bacterium]